MTALTDSPSFLLDLPFQTWHWQGHQIRYVTMGKGSPIVLVHGFGASIGHWRKNIPALVEAGYQIVAIDLLGFGGSDKPPIDYSLELWQTLLHDFCQTYLAQPAWFVGNSIGALLTLMLLANHPDQAKGGILLNAAGGLNHRPEELNPPLRAVMGLFSSLVGAKWVGPFLFNQVRRRSRIRETLKQVYCDHSAVTDELVEIIYQPSCDEGAQKVFASILSAPPGPRPQDLLPQIQQPLLVLWGEADPWTPISGSLLYQALAKESDRVQFKSISGAGHCPHDECPDVVNALMIDWLATVTPDTHLTV